MWLICESTSIVSIIWIYTHDEFKKRPEDSDLKRALKDAIGCAIAAIVAAHEPNKSSAPDLGPTAKDSKA